jgi:hypothetical protein
MKFPKGVRGGIAAVNKTYDANFGTEQPREEWPYRKPYPIFSMANRLEITPSHPARRFDPPGKCIYCHAIGKPLSEEHIIGEGLGARLIIPEASCQRCAERTGSVEQRVLRTVLWAPRRNMGIRAKKRKRKEDGFPVTTLVGGVEYKFNMTIQDHPTFLILPYFDLPGFLINRSIGASGLAGIFGEQLNPQDRFLDLGFDTIQLPILDLISFSQMLAKIAHCFTVEELGVDGFIYCGHLFATEKIDKYHQVYGAFHYVGGDNTCYAESQSLHSLGWHIIQKEGRYWIVVKIRLFANREGFAYQVFAGLLSPLQYRRARILAEARVRGGDETPAGSQ